MIPPALAGIERAETALVISLLSGALALAFILSAVYFAYKRGPRG